MFYCSNRTIISEYRYCRQVNILRPESGAINRKIQKTEIILAARGGGKSLQCVPWKKIEDYGLIGDSRTAALVGNDGSLEWCCWPYFDSPSVFGALLDPEKGGYFKIGSAEETVGTQRYLPDTGLLITRFSGPNGGGETTDFMPFEGGSRIVRQVRSFRDVTRFKLECVPGFDYARAETTIRITERGAVFESQSGPALELLSPVPLEPMEGGVCADFRLREGRAYYFILREYESDGLPEGEEDFKATVQYWRRWIKQCEYSGGDGEQVRRSALTLKMLSCSRTGGFLAAPTTSLPEHLGGERNWDYRYVWLRDGSLSLTTLLSLGFREEARAFVGWLETCLKETGPGLPPAIMYSLDGEVKLTELELEHLRGYMDSRPVRIGNGAAEQLQLDAYGILIASLCEYEEAGESLSVELKVRLGRLLDWLMDNWREADEGIWEVRGGRRQFVYSKLMCWAALDRGLRMKLPGDELKRRRVMQEIRDEILERGYKSEPGAFVQAYENEAMDASILFMPLMGFIEDQDTRWLSTLERLGESLRVGDRIYRYRGTEAAEDGLSGGEGTFTLCSFLYGEALAGAGRKAEAERIFEGLLELGGPLGLYAEEFSPKGAALGNYPQAFSHIGLIRLALKLER